MRGSAQVLDDVVQDLRQYQPLTDQLTDPGAIYQGFPGEDQGYDASVAITCIFDGDDPHRGAVTSTYRVQVTVTVTKQWRRDRRNEAGTTPLSAQNAIVDACRERLSVAAGSKPEAPLGTERGPTPEPDSAGRVSIPTDFRLRGTYETE